MPAKLTLVELQSRVVRATDSLPKGVSSLLRNLQLATDWRERLRACDCCETKFLPTKATTRFCSIRCSTKWWLAVPSHKARVYTPERAQKSGAGRKKFLHSGTPEAQAQIERVRTMSVSRRPEVRKKISDALLRMGHKPHLRGGNGRGPTEPQLLLFDYLGAGWELEVVVCTGMKPHHYKIDIANRERKIAVEVDGPSHYVLVTRAADKRKDGFLTSNGWTVLRFWNKDILDWHSTGKPMDHSISMTLRSNGIHPSPLVDS